MNIPYSIEQAKEVASAGDTRTAIVLLRQVITLEPRNVNAWLALADIVENPEQAQQCLERVIQIDPDNQIAKQRLYGEQPSDLDFLFGAADETVQEPEASNESNNELDFSNLYVQENQPSQSSFERSQPYQSISNQDQNQDVSTPSMPPPVRQDDMPRRQSPPRQRQSQKKSSGKKKEGLSKIEIALIGAIGFICLCLAFIGLAYVGASGVLNPVPTDLPENVTAVIYENIRASNTKDMSRYMATVHSRSPIYNSTEEIVKDVFSDEFTLSYRVSDVNNVEQGKDKAVIHFVLTTRLVSGPASFRDNRITGEMTLRKEDGAWKIYDQEVDNVKYLD